MPFSREQKTRIDHLPIGDGYNISDDDENSAIREIIYQEPKFWKLSLIPYFFIMTEECHYIPLHKQSFHLLVSLKLAPIP